MGLLYHRFMTPTWLGDNAEFNRNLAKEVADTHITIPKDTSKYESIFKVPLLPGGVMKKEDITVRMLIGVALPDSGSKRDSMSFMISDGNRAIGFQLRDPPQYYQEGPYIGIEGEPGRTLTDVSLKSPPEGTKYWYYYSSRKNPDQFEMVFKPREYWGSAFCCVDQGHKYCTFYDRDLDISKGLSLETYREDPNDTYVLNYIEVWIYEDSPKEVDADKLKKALRKV